MSPRWESIDDLGNLLQQKGPNRVYAPVRRCIYCGTNEGVLGKEHIIPFGLGGNLILPRASCNPCSKITAAMELTCQHKMLGPLRIQLNLPTRNPEERPTELSVPCVHMDGREKTVTVPPHLHPVIIHGLVLPPPILFREPGDPDEGHVWFKVLVKNQFSSLVGKGWRADLARIEMWTLARLFAKIGHSYAIAERGYASFKPLLIDLILGKPVQGFRYIGGDLILHPVQPGIRHQLKLDEKTAKGVKYLIVTARIFADLGAPACTIVVGEI